MRGAGAWCVRETPASAGPKPRLLESVRIALRLRHYSVRTERAYVAWIRRYVLLHGKRHPAEMGATEVSAFLSALAARRPIALVHGRSMTSARTSRRAS
jgi:hypothetical protein